MVTVLVTGAGGGVGQGVIKSLKMINDLPVKIIAADMSEKAAGLYAADMAYLVDRCDSDGYLSSLQAIFEKESVDFYVPGTDVELRFCAKHKADIKDRFGVHTVISSLETVEIADDKFKTTRFLEQNGFSFPLTGFLKDINLSDVEYPVIVKPAVGCRSIGVYKVNSEEELKPHMENPEGVLLQECIGDESTEYTCTIVKVNGKLSPVLALKRVLRDGDTYRAEPIRSAVIEEYVTDVASKLDIDGGCNFQLRLDKNGVPKVFEINSRFSGTTPFCAQLGFNPVEYYLKHSLGMTCDVSIDYNSIVLRYWSELIVEKQEVNDLQKNHQITPYLVKQFQFFE